MTYAVYGYFLVFKMQKLILLDKFMKNAKEMRTYLRAMPNI